jgi:hypothetical protein
MIRTIGEQQAILLNNFVVYAKASRGGDIPQEELDKLIAWYQEILQSQSAVHLVQSGNASIYWEDGEPVFTLTDKGLAEAPQEMKDQARSKHAFN